MTRIDSNTRNNIANLRRARRAGETDEWAGRPCVAPSWLSAHHAVEYRRAYEAAARKRA